MGGIPCRFFLPVADQTMAGVHDFFRRFSHSLSRVISKKVDLSSNEGHGPLEVRSPEAFFCSPSALGVESPALGYSPIDEG